MRAMDIVNHSLRQVFGNLSAALRISGLLYAVQALVSVVFGLSLFLDEAAMQQAMLNGGFPWGRLLTIVAVSLVTSLWIVVAWHRYILLEENTGGLPAFRGDRMLAYFGKSLLIGLVLVPVILIASILIAMVTTPIMTLLGSASSAAVSGVTAGILILVPIMVIATRLSLILPAAALGESMTHKQSWKATSGASMTILGVMAILMVASLVVDLPAQWLFGPDSMVAIVWSIVTGWFKMMIGASILTTLYGVYVEDRSLVFS